MLTKNGVVNMKIEQVKKHNRDLKKAYYNNEISCSEYFGGLLTVHEVVDTDEGLSAKDKICFHYFNPKGIYAQMPNIDEFQFGGKFWSAFFLYGKSYENYVYAQMQKLVQQKKPKKWDVDYIVALGYERLEEYKEWKKEKLEEVA